MSLDWYAKRLGGGAPQPSQRSSTPPAWPVQQAPPAPAYGPPPAPQIPQSDAPMGEDDGKMHVGDAIVRWRGGEGTRENMTCPNCTARGKPGRLMFSRTKGQGQSMGMINSSGQPVTPAASCFECGYNGLYSPFGGDLSM